jgi:3-deoxy-D-manno-octulosonate 8-phosphate phosphatase (KDO 8-P phosphatase)
VSPSKQDLLTRARRVKAIVLDVDGVLTDASLYYGARGEVLKAFSARDGFAIRMATNEGIAVAILSGRLAGPVRPRLSDLGIPREMVIQGSRDKKADVSVLAARIGVPVAEIAFMGDDLPDLPALTVVGLAACPADAASEVRERCHFVAGSPGGHGAVRELVKLLLEARGRWSEVVESWAAGTATRSFLGGENGPGRGRRRGA